MRGRKREEDLKNERVVVHVTLKEKKLIEAMAKGKGMDVGPYLRSVCIYEQWDKFFGDQ